MELHFLDVGVEQYGDCILVRDDDVSILIDGAHKNDIDGSPGIAALPDQIRAVLGVAAGPVPISLLIVTHCHGDHIGCLPEMVARGLIAPKMALVADENAGYGLPANSDFFDALPSDQAELVAALQEEPLAPSASDAEIARFLTDSASQRKRYLAMIETLEAAGAAVVRYRGLAPEIDELERLFDGLGLRILGPSDRQIVLCAEALAGFNADAARAADALLAADSSIVSAYRTLTQGHGARDSVLPDSVLSFLDREGPGAAKNNQSIVLSVGKGANRMLLTGDMQFAKAEVDGLQGEMDRLLADVAASGPYCFVKIPHHASYNAFDEPILAAFAATRAFGISTGRKGEAHPNVKVLRMLKKADPALTWARTDRNGRFKVTASRGKARIEVSAGELSDPQPKARDTMPAEVAVQPPAPRPAPRPPAPARREPPTEPAAAAPAPAAAGRDGLFVEVTARIPVGVPSVTIRVDIGGVSTEAPHGGAARADEERLQLGAGRPLAGLLFATHAAGLRRKIGEAGYQTVRRMVEESGNRLLEIGDPDQAFADIGRTGRDARGIVLLGDYDVLPAQVYDVLPPDLRPRVATRNDPDQFIVWSDQRYGDLDGDGLGEVPVSRVPDCASAAFVAHALAADSHRPTLGKFGSRNAARPFAENVFRGIAGNGQLLVSGPQAWSDIGNGGIPSGGTYFMLHGSDVDGSRFWGEDEGGSVEAVNLDNLGGRLAGAVALAGCCWGALTVEEIAARAASHWDVTPRTPKTSIALRMLELGALAFVGCTGAHYSPLSPPFGYFGAPIHESFWRAVASGAAPAQALFDAKKTYIRDMPHGLQTPAEWAIEYKVLRQFTCLGLGW
ncbi:hypothetical protein RHIZO_01529 [Rhizobiaceae bacterium]|nr:hypothetical protein RHIZO_01529 [Rhizobiaceae bacterium]